MLTDIILGVAVLALLIYRQLVARPVSGSGLRITAVLAIVGLLETVQFLDKNNSTGRADRRHPPAALVLAASFGALGAATVRIWLQGGQAWSRGNWLTAVLWIAAVAAHLGYDALVAHVHGQGTSGVGAATLVLYLAVSLGVQRIIVQQRARRLHAGGPPALTEPESSASRW